MRSAPVTAAVLLMVCSIACSRGREYEVRGQIVSVNPVRGEITVKHDDIRGFMPAMTMPFKVRDEALFEGRLPGELVRATLVVQETDAYLKKIERIGLAPLVDPPAASLRFELIEAGDVVPDAAFVDAMGRARRLSEWRGQHLVVTFIYTRCPLPNFCPLLDRHFAAVQQEIAADAALRERVHLLSVSFDPDYDTPAVLADHAKRAGADPSVWSFATGDRDEIDRFASLFGVSIIRESGPNAEIVHNLRTAVIDGDGRLRKVLGGNDWHPADLVGELRIAVATR